jgi:hypothetical protein
MHRYRLRTLIVLTALVAGLALPGFAAADTPKQATASMKIKGKQVSAAAWGRHLTLEFLTILQQDDPRADLLAFLDPAFQIQRANGTRANKAEYIASPAKLGAFAPSGYRVTRNGTTLVVSFSTANVETIDGVQYKRTPAPRLATFWFDHGAWTLLAYANFNAPS